MGELLPVIDNGEGVDCRSCVGACCRGSMVMDLTIEEALYMRRVGNNLMTVLGPVPYLRATAFTPDALSFDPVSGKFFMEQLAPSHTPLKPGKGRYVLQTDCTNLVEIDGWLQCGAYEQRPAVCRDFEVGSEKCGQLRVLRGVDKPDDAKSNQKSPVGQLVVSAVLEVEAQSIA